MIKQYVIKEHDSLRDIAKTQFGNPNKWVQIAIENNLDYPYVAKPGEIYPSLKVLYPGDTLMLTFSVKDSEKVYYTEHSSMQVPYIDLLMGTDIGLDNGNLLLVGGSHGIDFFTVKGTQNIEQAVLHKLKVKKSSLAYYPTYGTLIKTYIGNIGDYPTLEMIKAEFNRTIMEDPRIESVPTLKANFDGIDNVSLTAGLRLVGNFTASIAVRVSPNNVSMG